MTLEACIAMAIQRDLDIVEALPEVHDIEIEELDAYVERFVLKVQNDFTRAFKRLGTALERGESAFVSGEMANAVAYLPEKMVRKMCDTILELRSVEARLISDSDEQNVWEMKMTITLPAS